MPSYGGDLKNFIKDSAYEPYRKLADILQVGVSLTEGLNQALTKRAAYLDNIRYLGLKIAEDFTEADGGSKLYIGREMVLSSLQAWPIPHDAPYKDTFNFYIHAVAQGGLYDRWMDDLLAEARKEGRQRQKEKLEKQLRAGIVKADLQYGEEATNSKSRPLTLVHLQGPLMALSLGIVIAGMTFAAESISYRSARY